MTHYCFVCGRTDTGEHTDKKGRAYWVCAKHQDSPIDDIEHFWDGWITPGLPGFMQ